MSGKILITRPQEAADRFSKELHGQGFEVLSAPMLVIRALEFDAPDLSPYQALIFTSANGVRSFCERVNGRDFAVYVVGKQTQEEAQDKGFQEIYTANGGTEELVAMIANEAPDQGRPFLHVRGVDIAKPLDELLEAEGFNVQNLIVYEADAVAEISPNIVSAIKNSEIEGVMFFSKRTAENFVQLARKNHLLDALKSIKALCISAVVLECVQSLQWSETYASDQPDRAGMLALLSRVCAQAQQQGEIMSKDEQEEQKMSAAKKSKGQAIENAAEVIELFGGIRPMAKKIGAAVTTVQGWKKRDTIPAGRRQMILDAATEHEIDLSSVIDGAAAPEEASASGPANENQQETTERLGDEAAENDSETSPEEAVAETAAIAAAVESVLDKSEPVVLSDKVSGTSVPPAGSGIKAEPRSLDKRLRQTETNAIKKSTWINFTLLFIGLAAIGAYLLFGGQDKANQQRLGALEEDVGELRGDVDAVKGEQSFLKTLIPQDLDDRIQRIQDQATEAQQKVNNAIATARVVSSDVLGDDAGTLEERVAKLQEHAAGSEKIQALLARIQGMSEADIGQGKLDNVMAQLNQALAGAKGNLGVTEALDKARESTPDLNETFSEVPKQELKAAAMLLGMTQLRSALNRDNEAFGEDLQLLKNLVGGDDETAQENSALLQALDKLAPSAQEGVLTPSGLTREFRTLAGEAVVESLKGEDVSLGDKVTARFSDLLKVEKDGELVNGTPTQETISEAENMLEGGDISGAIAAIQELDGPAGAVMQPWLKQAKSTFLADSLKGFLGQGIGSIEAGNIEGLDALDGLGAGEIGIDALLPRESKFINDEKTGIQILVPGKALGSKAYR